MREKKLRNTNLLASRHINREMALLSVDMNRSKPSLLKLPNVQGGGGRGLGHINQPCNHNHSLDTKSCFYLNSPTSPLCLRPFWGLRHMRPHQKFYSHTELGLPVEKPVGTSISAYVSKCISSLSQGKKNENEIHSLIKIEKKEKYDYNITLYFLNFNIKIKLT